MAASKGIMVDELPTSFPGKRVRTVEVVQLMIDTLRGLGYEDTAQSLQRESGVVYQNDGVEAFRSALLEGNYVLAIIHSAKVPWKSEGDWLLVLFMLWRQEYLEMLAKENLDVAVDILRTKLTMLTDAVRKAIGEVPLTQCAIATPLFAASPAFPPLVPFSLPESSNGAAATMFSPMSKRTARKLAGEVTIDKFCIGPSVRKDRYGIISTFEQAPCRSYPHLSSLASITSPRKEQHNALSTLLSASSRNDAKGVKSEASRMAGATLLFGPENRSLHAATVDPDGLIASQRYLPVASDTKMMSSVDASVEDSDDFIADVLQPVLRPAKRQRTQYSATDAAPEPLEATFHIDGHGKISVPVPRSFSNCIDLDESEKRLCCTTQTSLADYIASGAAVCDLSALLLVNVNRKDGIVLGEAAREALLLFTERRLCASVMPPFRLLSLLGQAAALKEQATHGRMALTGSTLSLLQDPVPQSTRIPRDVRGIFTPHGTVGVEVMQHCRANGRFATISADGDYAVWDVESIMPAVCARNGEIADSGVVPLCSGSANEAFQRNSTTTATPLAPAEDVWCDWSRDGHLLALYASNRPCIAIINASTGEIHSICATAFSGISSACWISQSATTYRLVCGNVDGGMQLFEFDGAVWNSSTSWKTNCLTTMRSIPAIDDEALQDVVIAASSGQKLHIINTREPTAPIIQQDLSGVSPGHAFGLRVDTSGKYALISCIAPPPPPTYRPGTTGRVRQERLYAGRAVEQHSAPGGTIVLYDLLAAKVVRSYTGHINRRYVIDPCFGGKGDEYVLCGSEDGRAFVWNKEDGAIVSVLSGHLGPVSSVTLTPDGTLISSGDDGRVIVR